MSWAGTEATQNAAAAVVVVVVVVVVAAAAAAGGSGGGNQLTMCPLPVSIETISCPSAPPPHMPSCPPTRRTSLDL